MYVRVCLHAEFFKSNNSNLTYDLSFYNFTDQFNKVYFMPHGKGDRDRVRT